MDIYLINPGIVAMASLVDQARCACGGIFRALFQIYRLKKSLLSLGVICNVAWYNGTESALLSLLE